MKEGTATRVVDVQRQATRTLRLTVGFVVAAPISAVTAGDAGAWLPLHVFLVGALLTAISAATQLLAVTWSASPAPADATATLQRWLVAGGAVALIAGRVAEVTVVAATGGVAVLAGLLVLAATLVGIRLSSSNSRFHPAIDGYLGAIAFAALGAVLGLVMVTTDPGQSWSRIRDAHVHINLLGLVGIVVASTLPYFVATQARTRMSPAATPRALRGAIAGMIVAVAVAAGGHVFDASAVVAGGSAAYAVALVRLLGLCPRIGRRQLRWAGPRLLQLLAGVAWWIAAVGLLGADALAPSALTARAPLLLVVGGFAQVLVASLAYLGPVLRGGGHERLSAGFATTRSVASFTVGNLAAVAVLIGSDQAAAALLIVWAGVIGRTALRLR